MRCGRRACPWYPLANDTSGPAPPPRGAAAPAPSTPPRPRALSRSGSNPALPQPTVPAACRGPGARTLTWQAGDPAGLSHCVLHGPHTPRHSALVWLPHTVNSSAARPHAQGPAKGPESPRAPGHPGSSDYDMWGSPLAVPAQLRADPSSSRQLRPGQNRPGRCWTVAGSLPCPRGPSSLSCLRPRLWRPPLLWLLLGPPAAGTNQHNDVPWASAWHHSAGVLVCATCWVHV